MRLQKLVSCVNANLLLISAEALELYSSINQSEQSVIRTLAYVVASVEFGTTLTNNDATRQNGFATETLNAQAFSF